MFAWGRRWGCDPAHYLAWHCGCVGSAHRRDSCGHGVRAPFHWARVNDLTSDRLDPTSRMPEFKSCAVAVAAVRIRVPVPNREVIPG